MKITMYSAKAILLVAAFACTVNAYSKYGRTCKDIGCLPSESCVISQDSCSWNQQDGKECGSYPTCKKSSTVNSSPGASLNPAPDNTRVNPQPNPHGNTFNGNGYNPNSHQGQGAYGGLGIDPNQIFGNPNRMPQSNQPWNHLPIFPPNPTSGHASSGHGQQPIYQLGPQTYPQNPQSVPNVPSGVNPYQMPFAFGLPPGGLPNLYPARPPTRQPSLLDQFLYNKQGGRRNAGSTVHHSALIVILSVCTVLMEFILTSRR